MLFDLIQASTMHACLDKTKLGNLVENFDMISLIIDVELLITCLFRIKRRGGCWLSTVVVVVAARVRGGDLEHDQFWAAAV